jgi:septal ring factor EnvC (AmiA/AmiB activator)
MLEFRLKNIPIKKYKNIFKALSILLFLLSFLFLPSTTGSLKVDAVTQKDIDSMQRLINETKNRITSIRDQQNKLLDSINHETKNIETTESETAVLEQIIKERELQIQAVELEINKLEYEANLVRKEKELLEKRIEELRIELIRLNDEKIHTANLLYKLDATDQVFGDKDSFQRSILKQQKTKTLVKILENNMQKTKQFQAETTEKKDSVANKQAQLEDLQRQKEGQAKNLAMEKEGLAYQKKNKLDLLAEIKDRKEQLTGKKAQLATQEKSLHKEVGEYEKKIVELKNQLFRQNASRSAATVSQGQVVGFQGRTGLSCNPLMPGVVPTNNYCQVYGGTGPGWYYYDPVKYPTLGSHLHFMYMDSKGRKNLTWEYLFNSAYSREFQRKPMDRFSLGRGYHEDWAIDLVGAHGAPVYAVKPGKVEYYCIQWPPVSSFPDPAYGAIVYHYDGSKSQYWHLQRRPNSPPCKMLY